jgi:hypothetical protein
MEGYGTRVERMMRRLYETLSEKDWRRYAAVEAGKFGHGGVEYVAGALGCDPKTITQGRLDPGVGGGPGRGAGAKKGGGRRLLIDLSPQLEQNFLDVLRDHTAGDPMRPEVKWTDLTRREISGRLAQRGTPAGRGVVKRWFQKHGYVKRKARRRQCGLRPRPAPRRSRSPRHSAPYFPDSGRTCSTGGGTTASFTGLSLDGPSPANSGALGPEPQLTQKRSKTHRRAPIPSGWPPDVGVRPLIDRLEREVRFFISARTACGRASPGRRASIDRKGKMSDPAALRSLCAAARNTDPRPELQARAAVCPPFVAAEFV